MSGVEVIRAIRSIDPGASIVVVSNFDDDEHKRQAQEAGAAAFLTKSASSTELLETVTQVVADKGTGGTTATAALRALPVNGLAHDKEVSRPFHAGGPLMAREHDVLEQLVLGHSNRAIGSRLGISEKAVNGFLLSAMAKLGVSNRSEVAAVVFQSGLVERPPAQPGTSF